MTSYTDVELSAAMGERAQATVEAAGHDNFRVVAGDVTCVESGWAGEAGLAEGEGLCYLLLMEVLDNLPHDKVEVTAAAGDGGGDQESLLARQVVVERGEGEEGFRERAVPLTDALLSRALAVDAEHARLEEAATAAGRERFPHYGAVGGRGGQAAMLLQGMQQLRGWVDGWLLQRGAPQQRFVPTGALRLLETLRHTLPNHVLIAADFDALPPTSALGEADGAENAPIVSSSGGKVDHGHYTQNVGGADIFFATDFRWLASAYTSVMEDGAAAEVLSSRAFLEMHVNPERTETRTGYNPMLEDYANTAFFTGHSRAPQRVRGLGAGGEGEGGEPSADPQMK